VVSGSKLKKLSVAALSEARDDQLNSPNQSGKPF
jgi:hypothetical protein